MRSFHDKNLKRTGKNARTRQTPLVKKQNLKNGEFLAILRKDKTEQNRHRKIDVASKIYTKKLGANAQK